MRKAFLVIPIIMGLLVAGVATAHVLYKPFELNRITATAFDFLPSTLTVLDGVDTSMMYLHYARADATVTERVITPDLIFYDGPLRFTARGLEVTADGKYKQFRVNVRSEGLLECYEFASGGLECSASDGVMTVERAGKRQSLDLETFSITADKGMDKVWVHAEDSEGTVLHGVGDMTGFKYSPFSFPLNPGP